MAALLRAAAVGAGFAGLVAGSHYEKPPCQSDELAGHLASGARLCAPKCGASGACPTDVPAGATATPQCALHAVGGDKYCGLVCKADGECPKDSQCTQPMPHLPTGVCTYRAAASVRSAPAPAPPAEDPQGLFEEFAASVGRIYASAEERQRRFEVFAENLAHIAKMQSLDAGAVYTHTSPFADWTVEEFSARNSLKAHLFDANGAVEQDEPHNASSLPAAFDWREKGAVNPVKNQGSCGSCWAFSTVGNIEGVNFVQTKKLLSLSEQELVDCDKTGSQGDQGCQGGLPSNAFKFLISTKTGLDSEATYPYAGSDDMCAVKKADELVFITSWKQIASDEDQMAAALMQYGPLSIGINAGPMQWYGGGVADPWKFLCSPKSIDHGVVIVGFGSDPKKHWIIRNSWGPSWGEKGYYRIVRGKNACGLTSMPTTAVIGSGASTVVV